MRALIPLTLMTLACTENELTTKDDVSSGETGDSGGLEESPVLDDTGEQPEPPDCEAHPEPEALSLEPDLDCQQVREPGVFTPVVEWAWPLAGGAESYEGYDQVMGTPAVTQLNDDDGDGDIDAEDIPDLLVVTFSGSGYRGSPSVLRALDGASGAERWSVMGVASGINAPGGIAAADLEGDGDVEILVCSVGGGLLAFDHLGAELWYSAGACPSAEDMPAVHDMDADGQAEIIVANQVLDVDGVVLMTAGGGRGSAGGYGGMSFAADVTGDGMLELVSGNAVHRLDGAELWSSGASDGQPALGDLEGDGVPDLIVTTPSGIYRYEADTGGVVWGPMSFSGGGYGGPPTIADFDGDGEQEFGVAGRSAYLVYEGDGSELWSAPIVEGSVAITGSSVFDFEGDGNADVVYADQHTLWVFDGRDGSVKLEWPDHESVTVSENPIVVDLDGDDQAEIVSVGNDYKWGSGVGGVHVFGDADGTWVDAGRSWSQHAFHLSHINDDGSVPTTYTPHWQDHRTFRAGRFEGLPSWGLADLRPVDTDICVETCSLGEVELQVAVGNGGTAEATAAVVRVLDGGGGVAMEEVVGDVAPGEVVWSSAVVLPESSFPLTVITDPDGAVEECDEEANQAEVLWPCP